MRFESWTTKLTWNTDGLDDEGIGSGVLSLGLLYPPGQNLLNLLSLLALAVGESDESVSLGFHGQGTVDVAAEVERHAPRRVEASTTPRHRRARGLVGTAVVLLLERAGRRSG